MIATPATRPRRAPHALVTRSFVAAALVLIGTTCRDVPTEPTLNPSVANAGGLSVTPALDTLLVTEQVTLTARNINGSPINKQASWTSLDTNIATVVSTGFSTGRVTGRVPGTVTIRATSGNKDGTATVVVRQIPVHSVSVTPDSASLQFGDSTQYTAVPRDSAGNPLSGRVVAWSVGDTLIASVGAGGMARAIARGTTPVIATVEGVVGSKPLIVRVPQLDVPALATVDSANTGDTLVIAYSARNAQDAPDADSVIVRVGIRNPSTGAVYAAVRRALPRIGAGATTNDTARIEIGLGVPAGPLDVVAYADCRDSTSAANELRLTSCLAAPASAGVIPEGSETDNSRSATVVVRGPELAATALTAPDSIFTRTSVSATLSVSNSGSATAAGFDVVAGLYDVTAGTVVAASAVTTPVLGSRASRDVEISISIPALLDVAHTYEVRAYTDCKSTGTPAERLAACFTNPATAGEIAEAVETNNSATRAAVVASNVVRVQAQPDSSLITALQDTTVLTANAFDRGNALVAGVTFTWTSLDPTIVSVTGPLVRALATGMGRVVVSAEGRSDTARVYVVQDAASIVATADSILLGSLGETHQLGAVVRDRNANAIPGAAVAWASLNASVASVNTTGLVTAAAIGVTHVVASHGAYADTVKVTVTQLGARVELNLETMQLDAISDTAIFVAVVYDQNNNPIPNAPVTWSVSNPGGSVAQLLGPGAFLAAGNGSAVAKVTAENGTLADSASIVVLQIAASVVSTDTIRFTSLGQQNGIASEAFDHRGNPVTHTAVNLTNLDPAIVDLQSGVLTATSVGTARIIASLHQAADTTIAIVTQTVGSIELTPASAVTTAGGTFTVNATVRDENGQPISGRIVTWSSLNTNVATVNGTTTGQVMGVAEGVTAVVGTVDGVADTMPVAVNPAGYSHRWLGTTSSAWSDASNWAPGVPDTTSNVYVPASTPNQPAVDVQQAFSNNLKIEQGVTISSPPTSAIFAYGSVDNAGLVAELVMRGPGIPTVRGAFNGLGIWTNASLSGRTTATLGVGIGNTQGPLNGSSLDVNGQTLVAGTLNSFYGKLIQDAAADSVIVTGTVSWGGGWQVNLRSQLTAGVLTVGGDMMIWYADSAFVSAGTHKIVFTGSGSHQLWQPDTLAGFNDLEITGTVTSLQTVGVKGRLVMNAGSVLRSDDANAYLITHTSLPEGPGSVQLQFVKLVGDATLQANSTLGIGVSVEPTAHLRLNGRKLDVAYFQSLGRVTMNVATDTLLVRNSSGFYGVQDFAAGVLMLQGDLHTGSSSYPAFAWNVSGSHKTVFNGTNPQNANITADTVTTFQHVDVSNTQGVTLNGGYPHRTTVAGLLKLIAGGKVVLSSGDGIYYKTLLPDVANGVYQAAVVIHGNVSASASATFGSLFVNTGAQLRLAGNRITATSGFGVNNGGTFTMDNPGDTLITGTIFSVYGTANLSAGMLQADGAFEVSTYNGATWNVSGTHKTVFAGTYQQQANFTDTLAAHFQNVDVRNAQGVGFNIATTINGLLRLVDGGKVNSFTPMLKYTSRLPELSGGVYEANLSIVAGNVTATRNEVFPTSLYVDGGGQLRLAGKKIDAAYFGTFNGTLTMDNPADTLIVRNMAAFNGAANLSAGTTILNGDVQALYDTLGLWNPSGGHKTVFAGTIPQMVSLAKLNHVEVRNTQGITTGGVTVHGLLRLVAGGKMSSNQPVNFTTQLPEVDQGVYEVMHNVVEGNVTATRDLTLASNLIVGTGGNLTIGGKKIDVGYFMTGGIAAPPGTLTMNNPADTLIVRNEAAFYSSPDLTAGTLIVRGNLGVAGLPQGYSWAATGTHTTVFAGTVQQSLWLPPDGSASFANFKVDNAAGVLVEGSDSLAVNGALMGSGAGVLRAQNVLRLKVTGGLDVAGFVLDRVALDVTGALTRFDNVTFQNLAAPTLLRIRNAGTGSAFTMNNVVFASPVTSGFYWVDAEDTDAGTGAFTLDIVSPQAADGPAATHVTNGAVVGWRFPTP